MSEAPARLRLGIDAGGTFTDAVLLDAADRVVATAKSLTTRFDLSAGIGNSIAKLPPERLAEVVLVSLSTTLTTNAVVEGKGSPVCALLAGYDALQVKNSGLADLLGVERVVQVSGGHEADGRESCPLDLEAAREAILKQAPKVAAFAISATFGVRNPAHELALRALVRELCDRPVTCGHELASSLGAPRRALTAALNARMISHVTALIASVEATLARFDIHAPLMMVKGDGSITSAASALQRPVGTVLSGPAASVIGACALSGRQDGVVADMGGTTTDIAIVRNGRPALAFDGAMIGGWRPMVEAVRVYAIGLGGDSELRFEGSGAGSILIGPRRVVPLSLLGHLHPWTIEVLERQGKESPHPSQARFGLRLQADESLLSQLSPAEEVAWEKLCAGPVDIERANVGDRPLARAVAKLERKGLAIYSGFTPTDAAHVLGMSSHWSSEAALKGALVWSRQMRQLHGYGRWSDGDPRGPAQKVFEAVVDAICHKLIEAGLNDAGHMNEQNASRVARLLAAMVLERGRRPEETPTPVFDLRFAGDLPLVAVGAPAASWYPGVSRALGVDLAVPTHGDVANAVGAVLGIVSQRVHLTVTQPQRGVFRVFTNAGPRDFAALPEAMAFAREVATQEATALAVEAGAGDIRVDIHIDDTSAQDDANNSVFFEARVSADATGKPREAVR